MKASLTRTFIFHLIYTIWSTLIVILFIKFAGKISHIHGSSLSNLSHFLPKIAQIDVIPYLINFSGSFLGMSCFVIAYTTLGSTFLKQFWQPEKHHISDWFCKVITAFIIGEIIYSFIFLGLSITGNLYPISVTTILLVGFIIGTPSIKGIFLSLNDKEKTAGNTSRSENIILWTSIIIILFTSLFTSTRLSYDSVALYFSNAKLIATSHQLQSFVSDSFIVSTFHTGVLYSAIIQLFGDQAARLFSWINGIFIIIIYLGIAEKMAVSSSGKIIALSLFATSTAFLDLFGDGKIELTSTLSILTAIYWLISASNKKNISNHLLTGLFSGYAMITRPYNIILLGGFLATFFITKKEIMSEKAKSFVLIAIPIALITAIHLALNWIILGDLFAPIKSSLNTNANAWQWSFDPEQIWAIRAFYPLVAVFINTAQSLGNVSPLIILILPILLLKQSRLNISLNNSLRKISLIAIFILTVWITTYFTVLEIRYVFFLWIIIYLAIADTISSNFEHIHPFSKKISQGTIITLLLFTLARNIFIAVDAYAPINKNGIPQCGDFIFCNFLKPINEVAKPGERVLALNAYRYYLRPELFACSSKNTDYVKIRDASLVSNEAFWIEVHRQGYTYIAYERNYTVRHLYMNFSPNPENTPSWVQLNQLKDDMDGSFVSYKIEYIDPPYKAEKSCSQNSGVWLVENIP